MLVTRPKAQAEGLCQRIRQAGGVPISLPTLLIEVLQDTEAQQFCQSAANYDWLIFISSNAVEHSQACLPADLPATLKIAAIGKATAAALSALGLDVALQVSAMGTSESLLDDVAWSELKHQRILIMRGQGGREQLADTLRERGAEVDYANLYRRICPPFINGQLSSLLDAGIDILTISSGEALENLLAMAAAEQCKIKHLPLVVMSERLRLLAEERGFTDKLMLANETSDAGMTEAIRNWRETVTME